MIYDFHYLIGEWLVLGTLLILTLVLIRKNFPSRFLDFILAIFVVIAISETLKYFLAKPRPNSEYFFAGNSFPSTHASLAFMAFFFYSTVCHSLAAILKRGGKYFAFNPIGESVLLVVMFALAVSTGLLRVTLGAHDVFDVFAGIILGLLVSSIFIFYDVSGRRVR